MPGDDGEAGQGYSTGALAAASGYSVQQVRDLERLGVLPPAHRQPNGYRLFAGRHLRALNVYRDLAVAAGPVAARSTLRQIYVLPADRAVALISQVHRDLLRAREEALAGAHMLRLIGDEAAGDAQPAPADAMTITELAGALGVRTSTLRFWERCDLVRPERVTSRQVRSYPVAAVREARITAALRSAGYRIPQIQELMEVVRGLGQRTELQEAQRSLQHRIESIAQQMCALLRAGADILPLLGHSAEPRRVAPVGSLPPPGAAGTGSR